MGSAVELRSDFSAAALRRFAKKSKDGNEAPMVLESHGVTNGV